MHKIYDSTVLAHPLISSVASLRLSYYTRTNGTNYPPIFSSDLLDKFGLEMLDQNAGDIAR